MGIEELIGKTLTNVYEAWSDGDEVIFECNDGTKYKMYHSQDCCESVHLEDIAGSLMDLVGMPVLAAYESSNRNSGGYGSETWTFYHIGTMKGFVTFRWYGTSNGYYSESADFSKVG